MTKAVTLSGESYTVVRIMNNIVIALDPRKDLLDQRIVLEKDKVTLGVKVEKRNRKRRARINKTKVYAFN